MKRAVSNQLKEGLYGWMDKSSKKKGWMCFSMDEWMNEF